MDIEHGFRIKNELTGYITASNRLIPTILIALIMLYARKLSPISTEAFSFPLQRK